VNATLVAGGSTGIGAAAVRAFCERGDTVFVADRDAAAARELSADYPKGRIGFLECDFAEPGAAAAAVESAAAFHSGALDTVFYNAAILEAHALADWTVEAWDRSTAVNLRAPFLMAQAAAPLLKGSEHGRFVVTSSTGAFRGHAGMPAYHATKAGLLGMVRALADELGPDGVTVNAVCPGWVDTRFNNDFWAHQSDPKQALALLESQIPLRRQAVPEEITGLLLFLASPASAYLTGQALVIDGGYTSV
jgi:NAD(P)-dependent dehydrogenase (short-subunit alcohol dehydrogenase family)